MIDFEKVEKLIKKEGDSKIFQTAGLACLILRHPRMQHLCGYVGVPVDHPMYGEGEDAYSSLHAHGGITWSGPFGDQQEEIPEEYHNYYWYGFDCAHAGDLAPGLVSDLIKIMPEHADETMLGHARDVYRDLEYVTQECMNLANQTQKEAAKKK